MDSIDTERHRISRLRQEPKRRTLTVAAITDLGPRMRRIAFTSPELADFASPGFDDHIKIFVPDLSANGEMVMRDFTPRRFDGAGRRLVIDFALHDTGPATVWARNARLGDSLQIAGPRGSTVVADDFDWYLLMGDETALPAIGRRIEELRAGARVTALAVVEGPDDVQTFDSAARVTASWLQRREHGPDDAATLRKALGAWVPPPGEGFIWIAAEAATARALKLHALERIRHPAAWMKAAGYWVSGAPGASDRALT